MEYDEILNHFHVAKRSGSSAQCYCPLHSNGQEKNPSLTISRGDKGNTLLFCHVCGREKTGDILSLVGLSLSDLGNKEKHGKSVKRFAEYEGRNGELSGARFVASYDYSNESGYCYTKVRTSLPGGRKLFRFCITNSNGEVKEYKVEDRKKYKALYPFYQLQDAKSSGDKILYVEGEKDCQNAIQDGFHAITAGSANDWNDALTNHFTGFDVIIVPDNDMPGKNGALSVAKSLKKVASSVKVISWPDGTPEKYDYSDYIESFSNRAEGIQAFKDLIDKAVTIESFENSLRVVNETPRDLKQSRIMAIADKINEIEHGNIFGITDQKCGEHIGRIFKHCRFNVTSKSWYFYDGKRWKPDFEGMVIEKNACLYAEALYYYSLFSIPDSYPPAELTKFRSEAGKLSQRARRLSAIADARKMRSFSTEDLDRDRRYMNFNNCILDLDTLQKIEHSPDYLLSKISKADYNPDADPSEFVSFISEVMQNDAEKIHFLQRWYGYCLTGNPKEECFLIFYNSTTRNGKTTTAETMAKVFGDYACSIQAESLACRQNKNGSQANDDIARLHGVRLVNCPEPAKNMRLDEGLLKRLTGNNTITARHLNERFFDFPCTFSIVLDCNHLPSVTDMSIFDSGRVLVLPFERHFDEKEQNKDLKQILAKPENLSSALNWALDGLRHYREEGLNPPESVRLASEHYREESDKIRKFLNECLERDPGSNMKAGDAYEEFKRWCQNCNLGTESKQNFLQMLRARNLLLDSGTVNGITQHNVLSGYKKPLFEELNDDEELPQGW